jgi:UDP-N-acetylmuramate--alanine ligase
MRVMHRAAALASVMAGRRVTAVAGTHGKTTTTSMITTVFRETGADPGYVIGGTLAATGTNAADGAGPDFVAEADESDGSFLMLSPDAAVVTNVEADHLDNYGTAAAYRASFGKFAARIVPGGLLVTCADDPGARDLAAHASGLGLRVRSYGESADADYRVSETLTAGMQTRFTIRSKPGPFGIIDCDIRLGVPGRHNALNAAAAFAAATELGTPPEQTAAALACYRGAARRMEPKGEAGGVRVLDTYAHHPTELAADLQAARAIAAGGRVVAVFQPHLYSRTRIFAAEFGAALGLADEVVVLDVYAAREDPEPGVTGRLVADAVPGGGARYVPSLADAPRVVADVAVPGDLVLTMGAGDVTRLGPLVLAEISASPEAARS